MNKQTFTVEELERLTKLISWAVSGPEHGVLRNSEWKPICKELTLLLRSKGYEPHGLWADKGFWEY